MFGMRKEWSTPFEGPTAGCGNPGTQYHVGVTDQWRNMVVTALFHSNSKH